jgi:hypothetical protein
VESGAGRGPAGWTAERRTDARANHAAAAPKMRNGGVVRQRNVPEKGNSPLGLCREEILRTVEYTTYNGVKVEPAKPEK